MNHNACYGNLFPSVNSPRTDITLRGKVFAAALHRAGGLAVASRQADVDIDAWDECLGCNDFDACYKLSMAKLALETGVMQN